MIRGLILDGEHEGHLAGPQPSVRMARPMPMLSVTNMLSEGILPDRTELKTSDYKAVFRPLDGGNLWLYAEKESDNVFFSQRRDWVTKDKWQRVCQRKDIVVEDNDPHKMDRNKRIEDLKSLIKQNVVAKHDFDLEGHLWALCHAVR
jgi:hypothetical protein